MNAKEKASLVAAGSTVLAVAPYVAVAVGAAYVGYKVLCWAFPNEEKKPETVPPSDPPDDSGVHTILSEFMFGKEEPKLPVKSAGSNLQKREIPADSARKSTIPAGTAQIPASVPPSPSVSVSAPVSAPVPPRPVSVPSPSVVPASIPVVKAPEILVPTPRKLITRDDMAKVFKDGRRLSRKQAVAELRKLGFGQSAAYEALSASGRFASWLQIAPDGIITWKSENFTGSGS